MNQKQYLEYLRKKVLQADRHYQDSLIIANPTGLNALGQPIVPTLAPSGLTEKLIASTLGQDNSSVLDDPERNSKMALLNLQKISSVEIAQFVLDYLSNEQQVIFNNNYGAIVKMLREKDSSGNMSKETMRQIILDYVNKYVADQTPKNNAIATKSDEDVENKMFATVTKYITLIAKPGVLTSQIIADINAKFGVSVDPSTIQSRSILATETVAQLMQQYLSSKPPSSGNVGLSIVPALNQKAIERKKREQDIIDADILAHEDRLHEQAMKDHAIANKNDAVYAKSKANADKYLLDIADEERDYDAAFKTELDTYVANRKALFTQVNDDINLQRATGMNLTDVKADILLQYGVQCTSNRQLGIAHELTNFVMGPLPVKAKFVPTKTPPLQPVEGRGVKPKRNYNTKVRNIVFGSGLSTEVKNLKKFNYFQHDVYLIDLDLLAKNIINVKYVKNSKVIEPLRQKSISKDCADVIKNIIDDKFNNKAYNLLSKAEKALIRLFVRRCKFTNVNIDDSEVQANQKRYELLLGEVRAGNNNPDILKELRGYVQLAMTEGQIGRVEGTQLLLQLSSQILDKK